MTRRAHGEGSIYQSADGKWHGSVNFGQSSEGKRLRKQVNGKSQAEVKAKLKRLLDERDAGLVPAGATPTVEQWLEYWLSLVARTRKASTYKTYRTNCAYAMAEIGNVRIDRVTTEQIEGIYVGMSHLGLTPASEASCHRTLHSAFGEAVKRGRIIRNPVTNARHRPVRDKEVIPLTVDEAKAVLGASKAVRQSARWEVALALGLRQGEALGLQWGDIDLTKKTLRVRRAVSTAAWQHGCASVGTVCGRRAADCPDRHGGGVVIGDPKSAKAKRTISIPDNLIASLNAHKAAQAQERLMAGEMWSSSPDWVFSSPKGKVIRSGEDWAAWKKLLKSAGVRQVRLHDARHTAATFMLITGVEARVVMDIFGWTQMGLTTRYQHVVPELHQEAARRMDRLLWGDD